MRRARDSYERRLLSWHLRFAFDIAPPSTKLATLFDEWDFTQGKAGDVWEWALFRVGYAAGWNDSKKEHELYIRSLELRAMPYAQYLATPEWKQKRDAQVAADGGRCRLCNSDGPLEVHHRTYKNRGYEQYGDLVTLCRACHQTFHDRRGLWKNALSEAA